MANWLSRWFDRPKGRTLLRRPTAANPPGASLAETGGRAELKPGELILGKYRVLRELGHGSMGIVHLVVNDESPGLRFAVKRIRVAGDVYRRNFVAELQTWMDLDEHPNLVPCRFFRSVGDELVIFAEYVEGATLARWIADENLTRIETLLDFAIQLAWGLHATHEQGFIHQDVKPSNVLIASDGTVKVTDFGLARARARAVAMQLPEGDLRTTILVAHAGGMTDEYCSPEQAQGQPLSRRSDLWSWGVSVLEMFAGRATWRSGVMAAAALEDLLEAQASGKLSIEDRPRMPASVATVLRRCFRDNPEERWPTLLEAAQVLVGVYREVCGAAYPRSASTMHRRERGEVADLDRKIDGATWSDPKAWLIEALKAAGRDPAEADTVVHSTRHAHSRKAQAIGDLGTYQEAQTIFERLIRAGRRQLRERLIVLSADQALVHRFVDDAPGAIRSYDRLIAICERLISQEGRDELSDNLAMAYMNKALVVSDLGDKQAAVGLYDKAIAIRERLVNQQGQRERSNELAQTYRNKATSVSRLGDKQAAVGLYDKAIAIFERLVNQEGRRELSNELARTYMNKANAVCDLGDKQAAVGLYDKAIAIYEGLVVQEGRHELSDELARTYMNKATTVRGLGHKQAAVGLHDRAIAIYERLVNQEGRRELSNNLATTYMNKALVVSDLDDRQAAVRLYDKAIAIYERLVNQEGRYELSDNLAMACSSKANAVSALGNEQAAVGLYDKAIAIYERLVNREGRRELSNELARTYTNKATSVSDLGDKQAAVGLCDKAIAIRERLVNQEGRRELSDKLAMAYMIKATAVSRLGDKAAVGLFDKAITIYERLVNREGRRELSDELALTYMNKANAVHGLGDKRAAVGLHDRAIAIYERLVNQEGRHKLSDELAWAYMNKAASVLGLGDKHDKQAAVDLYDKAIAIRERLVYQEGRRELAGDLAEAQLDQATVLRHLGERARASALARRAVSALDSEVKRTGRTDWQGMLTSAQKDLADLL